MTASCDCPHCPRCGVPLDATEAGALVCRPGGMELSELARLHLLAWLRGGDAPIRVRRSSSRVGGRWHCPADGCRLREDTGTLSCPRCGRHLPPRLVYQLVEFNWHAPTGD